MDYGDLMSLAGEDAMARERLGGHSMPRLSELQMVFPSQNQFDLTRGEGIGEESLVEDKRSNRSGSNVVEEKLMRLLQNSNSRLSFLRSRLSQLSR